MGTFIFFGMHKKKVLGKKIVGGVNSPIFFGQLLRFQVGDFFSRKKIQKKLEINRRNREKKNEKM